MEEEKGYKNHMQMINGNAKRTIELLESVDLTFDEGIQVLKKALYYLERASLKNKIKSTHRESRLFLLIN